MEIEFICILMAAFSVSITIYECMYVRKKTQEERYIE